MDGEDTENNLTLESTSNDEESNILSDTNSSQELESKVQSTFAKEEKMDVGDKENDSSLNVVSDDVETEVISSEAHYSQEPETQSTATQVKEERMDDVDIGSDSCSTTISNDAELRKLLLDYAEELKTQFGCIIIQEETMDVDNENSSLELLNILSDPQDFQEPLSCNLMTDDLEVFQEPLSDNLMTDDLDPSRKRKREDSDDEFDEGENTNRAGLVEKSCTLNLVYVSNDNEGINNENTSDHELEYSSSTDMSPLCLSKSSDDNTIEDITEKEDDVEDITVKEEDVADITEIKEDVEDIMEGKEDVEDIMEKKEDVEDIIEKEDVEDTHEVLHLDEIRRRNKAKLDALLQSVRDAHLEEQFALTNKTTLKKKPEYKPRKSRKSDDASVSFHITVPLERRKSERLQKQAPNYNETDLENIQENVRNTYFKRPHFEIDDNLVDELEKIVYKPKKSRKSTFRKNQNDRIIIRVEDVTQEMINNIATRVADKVYSEKGTSCHQCRQKTLDQKTCCRSPNCSGGAGMFCGVCIKNRYGEECAEILLDPKWICPVCRGKCNCSICRVRQGKRPTGVLAPAVLQQGYSSVDHFLTEHGETSEKKRKPSTEETEVFIGFNKDGSKINLLDGTVESASCGVCTIVEYNKRFENKEEDVLGFSKDGMIIILYADRSEPLLTLDD